VAINLFGKKCRRRTGWRFIDDKIIICQSKFSQTGIAIFLIAGTEAIEPFAPASFLN
jgi:hypothetical protein